MADEQANTNTGRDMSQANPLNKAAHSASPGMPRSIRSRTGQTEDPIPEGKHLAEHKVRLPMVAAEEEGKSPVEQAAIAQGAHAESAKSDKKAHKEEMQRLHGEVGSKFTKLDTSKAGGAGNQVKDNKMMDSRRSHFGQSQQSGRS